LLVRITDVDNQIVRIRLNDPEAYGQQVRSLLTVPAKGESARRSQAGKIAASTRSAASGLSLAMKLQMSERSPTLAG
jgi:hypothetical protein